MVRQRRRGLGDVVEYALRSVGITPESVEKYLGSCGGCNKRKVMLNKLSDWANSLLSGSRTKDEAIEDLTKIDRRIKKELPKEK